MSIGSSSRIMIVAGAMLLAPSAAQAGPVRSAAGTVVRAYPDQIAFTYRQALKSLRADSVRQQQRDGGTLSADSQRIFQARFDRINARFARAMRNKNPLSIDSTGRPRAVATASDWTNADLFITGRQ